MGLDIAETSVFVFDPANVDMIGYANPISYRFMLFTEEEDAYWIADRYLKEAAFPFATVVLRTNRELFRLQPGDLFKFAYSAWGVSSMICRVMSIQEEELGSEEIIVTAREDIDYLSGTVVTTQFNKPSNLQVKSVSHNMGILLNVKIIEAPYYLSGDEVKIIPIAARVTRKETGYYLYESVDSGTTYTLKAEIGVYNPYGILSRTYIKTASIDNKRDIYIDFKAKDYRGISNIEHPELYSTKNLALLGEEFISFQYISLSGGTVYKLSAISRGLFGSNIVEHSPGEEFYFLGDDYRALVSFNDSPVGSTRKYKFVPYTSSGVGDINYIDNPVNYTYWGAAFTPYQPVNLKANGKSIPYAEYIDDIVLTWGAGVRGTGAGLGDPDTVTDDTPDHEGKFRVVVYGHSDILGLSMHPDALDFVGEDGDPPNIEFWGGQGEGTELTIQNNKLNYSFTGTGGDMGYIRSIYDLTKPHTDWYITEEFDIQIEFEVTDLPVVEDVGQIHGFELLLTDLLGSNIIWIGRRRSETQNGYSIYGSQVGEDNFDFAGSADSSGKIRLARSAGSSTIQAYYWSGSQWEWDGDTDGYTFDTPMEDRLRVSLEFSKRSSLLSTTLDITVDNLTFNAGEGPKTWGLARTVSDIDALTWTYTESMNDDDNCDLSKFVTFKVSNYIVDPNTQIEYESDIVTVLARAVSQWP